MNAKEDVLMMKKKIVSIFIIIVLSLSIIWSTLATMRSPEYALYQSVQSIKMHNYQKASLYINIDKIAANRANEARQELLNMPELKNNPFAGFAVVMFDGLINTFTEAIKTSFKDIVESPDNIFTDVSSPKLIAFLIIKKYDNVKIIKHYTDTKDSVYFQINKENEPVVQILLDKNNNTWQITDILGYTFWEY